MRRRTLLSAPVAFALGGSIRQVSAKTPSSEAFTQYDLLLDGDRKLARRALLLVPKAATSGAPQRLLVALHGLGETHDELLGIHAWGDAYGLVKAYERLSHPPIERTLQRHRYLTDERLHELNATLAERPFRGFAVVCPVTPNPQRFGSPRLALDRYSEWLATTLLPAVRRKLPVANVGLDGCSLGGYVGLEVFLRKPELFASLGAVQSAISVRSAAGYAESISKALGRVGFRPIHIETSTGDPYRGANVALAKKLGALGVPNELRVPPGPHNQPWLREIGTLEMLLFHDRRLGART